MTVVDPIWRKAGLETFKEWFIVNFDKKTFLYFNQNLNQFVSSVLSVENGTWLWMTGNGKLVTVLITTLTKWMVKWKSSALSLKYKAAKVPTNRKMFDFKATVEWILKTLLINLWRTWLKLGYVESLKRRKCPEGQACCRIYFRINISRLCVYQ